MRLADWFKDSFADWFKDRRLRAAVTRAQGCSGLYADLRDGYAIHETCGQCPHLSLCDVDTGKIVAALETRYGREG